MPKVDLTTSADRSEGVLDNMHPRLTEGKAGAEVILTPHDLLERRGNFLEVDSDGNPDGFKLVAHEPIVSRNVWMGTSQDLLTKQNTIPVALYETSFPINGPLADGDETPEPFVLSSLPKPPPPTFTKIKAEVAGYPASSLERPFWIAYSYLRDGTHGELAPATLVPPLAQGQCIRLKLPDTIPPGVTQIGIWLSTPGQSSASTAGQMRLQKTYPLSAYAGHEIELVGHYVYSTTRPGDTSLPSPGAPKVSFKSLRKAARVGTYRFAMSVANELGESLPSPVMGPYTIPAHSYFGDDNPAGYGQFTVTRRALPQGSAGWYLYVSIDGQWYRLYNVSTSEGLRKPLSTSLETITFGGWSGSEFYGKGDTWLLGSGEIPIENTSGVENPETPLDTPTIFGASRPAAGRYYGRVSELTETEESPLSDIAYVDIGEDELPLLIFGNRINQLPNATFVEEGADGLPLFYQVDGNASLDDGTLIIKSGEVSTDAILVDNTKQWSADAFLEVSNPETGAFSGTFEVILKENATTETVLKSVTSQGEYRYRSDISPAGYSGITFQPDTRYAQIIYRISGNMIVCVSRQLLADYLYSFRRRGNETAIPTGTVQASTPPSTEVSPETLAQVEPNRPTSSGTSLATGDFESAMPTLFTQHSQNAVLAREAGAALVGTTGLASRKTTGGSAGFAYLDRTFDPEPGLVQRNSLAVSTRRKIPTLPVNGSITLQELKDVQKFAWIDYDSRHEVSELEIAGDPTTSGNIVTTLDEGGTPTPRNTSLVATKEAASLIVTGIPTQNGSVGVALGGTTTNVPATIGRSAVKAVVRLEVTRGAARSGGVAFYLGSPEPNNRNLPYTYVYAPVSAGDSPEVVAQKLRGWASSAYWQADYWIMSGSGRFITFTAKFGAPINSMLFFSSHVGGNETYASARATVLTQGVSEITPDTTETVARRIRETSFPGYKTSATSNTSEVVFEALEPGAKADASYDPRATGATATMTTTVQGDRDTIEEVADKVVATYAGNTYWSAVRSNSTVTFTSLTSGAKQDATFSPGTTETAGKMSTPIQGSSDIVVYAEDSFGILRQKRILTDITNTTVFDIEHTVSGAGTPPSGNSQAVLQFWASKNAEPKELVALFEDIDYEQYAASTAALGVTAESSSSLTWEVYTDVLSVTDRGETYYRYHDYEGELLNQVHIFMPPGYLPVDGIGIQEGRIAVLPGTEYTMAGFLTCAGVKNPARPVYLYGVTPDDDVKEIGSLTEEIIDSTPYEWMRGTQAWQEFTLTFTTPPDCHELRIESRDIGEGEIVIQELVPSLGPEAKRTNLYASEGTYSATLDLSTPNIQADWWWGRERKILEAGFQSPPDTGISVEYRTADFQGDTFDAPVSDVSLVAQKPIIRIDYSATGNGVFTPVIPPGSPHAEYVLLTGTKPLSTLLKEDRTELDGGVIFPKRDEFIEPADIVFTPIPGGRISTAAIFGPVGNLPELVIEAYDPETVRYITHRAGLMPFVVETREQILTIRLSGSVRFKRIAPDSYKGNRRQAVYRATLPASWVTEVQDLP